MNKDICTDEINDDIFGYDNSLPCTSELSDELSAMLKSNNCESTFNKKKEEMELEKLLSDVSEVQPRSKPRSNPRQNQRSRYTPKSSSFSTKSKCDDSKMVHKLKNDMYKMLDLIHNLDEEVKDAKQMCYTMKELDDKIYEFIQCQINQKMDTILDTMNLKFEDIEKRISKIYKGFSAVSCRK
jgi:hypothetical protein